MKIVEGILIALVLAALAVAAWDTFGPIPKATLTVQPIPGGSCVIAQRGDAIALSCFPVFLPPEKP